MVKITNPFRLEEYRAGLASREDTDGFKRTYSDSSPEITDTNTPTFWDNENVFMENLEFFKNPMAIDRGRFVARTLGDNQMKAIDVGLGSGIVEDIYYKLFPKGGIKFYGIDFSPKSILSAKKRFPKGEFKKGSILKIPYKDKTFDSVICLEVMEHIVPSKTFQALSELWRTLKSNGILILSIPLNEGLEEMIRNGKNPNHHVRVYSPLVIKKELELAGFKVVKEKYLYAFGNHYFLKTFLARTFLKNKKLPNNIILIARKP
jgi:SAM-dependent methyltransferase